MTALTAAGHGPRSPLDCLSGPHPAALLRLHSGTSGRVLDDAFERPGGCFVGLAGIVSDIAL